MSQIEALRNTHHDLAMSVAVIMARGNYTIDRLIMLLGDPSFKNLIQVYSNGLNVPTPGSVAGGEDTAARMPSPPSKP